MINLRNFSAAMEGFSMEEGDEKVTIEQVVEIEEAADAETEEVVEVEEAVDESEDVADETEQMLATLEYAAHAEAVIEEFGWSRPVATMLNKGQDSVTGTVGDIEAFLGITLPANESLEMVSSAYDDNTVVAMEGFKQAMKDFWEWIKKQCRKIAEFFKNLWDRIVSFFRNSVTAAKRYAEAIKKANIDQKKLKEKEVKLVYAGSFVDFGGVVDKASAIQDELSEVIATTSRSLSSGNAKSVDSFTVHASKTLTKAVNLINEVVKDGASISDGVMTISANKTNFKEKFEAKKQSILANGWNESVAMDWKIVANCDRVAQRIKANKSFINSIKVMQDLEVRHTRLSEGKEEGKKLKKGAKEHLKGINILQKFLSVIAKLMSYAIRQFIRGQRAVLSCRA